MTKREVEALFHKYVMPGIRKSEEQRGSADYPMRSEAWCNFTDDLHKEGRITAKQYKNWSHIECCYSPSERRKRRERKSRLVARIMES